MAVNATAVWRVRPSGSNTNGGGCDCSISSAATGTNGSLSGVTFTDSTAAAFTSSMAGSAINISGVGQFLIATYISASQITLSVGVGGTLPQLAASVYSWTVSAGKDYSQQNSAQASGTNGTASGTTAFSDTTAVAFTSAMVGNALYITGSGFTTGFYFCTAFTDSSHITLDRSPGTGTTATWHLGGGWADYWNNTDTSGNFGSNAATWIVPGNTIYVLGSGVPNPSSYTYDYTINNYFTLPSGSHTTGRITLAADPNTPSYSSGGSPVTSIVGLLMYNCRYVTATRLYLVATAATENASLGVINNGSSFYEFFANSCVFDQNGYDLSLSQNTNSPNNILIIGCEVFSSQAKRSTNAQYGIALALGEIILSNIHDCIGPGIYLDNSGQHYVAISFSIIAKCGGTGITTDASSSDTSTRTSIRDNTIDGNSGSGINFSDQYSLAITACFNNIVSNHTTGSTYGMTVGAGTAAENSAIAEFINYNSYYNNTTNYNAINAGPNDTALGTNPYVGQSTENYTLA